MVRIVWGFADTRQMVVDNGSGGSKKVVLIKRYGGIPVNSFFF